MMAEASLTMPNEQARVAPAEMPVENGVLAVWTWLAAESVFFATFIAAFLIERGALAGAPGLAALINIPLTFVGTAVLLTSSLTMALAVSAVERGRLGRFRAWLGLTALLGAGFLAFQADEFHRFYRRGYTFTASPQASSFFTLTGFHGMHVFFGLFWLLTWLGYSFSPRFAAERGLKTRLLGLYWHFVDVVWVVIFSVVYLLTKVG